MQVQAICDHSGAIMWYTGPHMGTRHDVRLFREHPPPLGPLERILGDKAYVGERRLYAPLKKKAGKILTAKGRGYNMMHSWYRSTIEHCFAYIKRSEGILA